VLLSHVVLSVNSTVSEEHAASIFRRKRVRMW